MTYYLGNKSNYHDKNHEFGGWEYEFGNGDAHGGRDSGDGGFIGVIDFGDGESGDMEGNGTGRTTTFHPALIFEYHNTLQHSVMLAVLMPLIRRGLK